MATKPVINQPANVTRSRGKIGIDSNVAAAIPAALNYEVMVAWHSLASDAAIERFYDKAFPALQKGLDQYLDARALVDPESLHHVYEWNRIGERRLWQLRRQNTDGGFKITYRFLPSRTVAPIAPVLREPGPSGKFVRKSSVFRNKAIVMESGAPVTIRRKSAKFLAIPAAEFRGAQAVRGIIFSRGPVTIRNPGGPKTTFAFARNVDSWFRTGLATKYLKSTGEFSRLEKATVRAGNEIPAKIRRLSIKGSISRQEIDSLAESAARKYVWYS